MKSITYLEYANRMEQHIADVLVNGEIVSVQHPKGTFVMMEEAEYKMLHDAMELVIHSCGKK